MLSILEGPMFDIFRRIQSFCIIADTFGFGSSSISISPGGDSFCVTRGVVSRMDLTDYAHGAQSLLAVQTDAAINAGNSGGPVVRTDDALCIATVALPPGP